MSGNANRKASSFTWLIVARALPLLAVLAVFGWQWATVHANYGGNWSALYCTGSRETHPDLVKKEDIYVFPKSAGYDGQFYHYLAHDPFLRGGLKDFLDVPRLRSRRILAPVLAYLLALGQSRWIDRAYEVVFLGMIAMGMQWAVAFSRKQGLSPWWGLFFLAIPAVPVTMDRLVVDGALAVLTVGFVYYSGGADWTLWMVLACAALTRETGLLLAGAAAGYALFRREFRSAVGLASSAIPALAWYAYVDSRTQVEHFGFTAIPMAGVFEGLKHPFVYAVGTPLAGVIAGADYLALAGALLAVGLAFYALARRIEMLTIAAVLFALLETVQREDHWRNVYDFGRLQSPLLICLAGVAAKRRKPWMLAPVAMMLPRLAMQLAPQAIGVWRWM